MNKPGPNYTGKLTILLLGSIIASGCVTQRVENIREGKTGLAEGEGIVIMAKSYHLGNETETQFIDCVGDSVGRGSGALRVLSLIHI